MYIAMYFECGINKNALPQTVFWRFCPLDNNTTPKPIWTKTPFY